MREASSPKISASGRGGARSVTRQPRILAKHSSASATASPPSEQSWAARNRPSRTQPRTAFWTAFSRANRAAGEALAILPVHREQVLAASQVAVAQPADQRDLVAGREEAAAGVFRAVVHQAHHADRRRREDGLALGLVVEARRCRDTTGVPSARQASVMPRCTRANCHMISGRSGLPKLRQSVTPSGSPPDAAHVARGLGHRLLARPRTDRGSSRADCSRSSSRAPSRCRVRRARPPRRPARAARRCRAHHVSYCSVDPAFERDRRAKRAARAAPRPRSVGCGSAERVEQRLQRVQPAGALRGARRRGALGRAARPGFPPPPRRRSLEHAASRSSVTSPIDGGVEVPLLEDRDDLLLAAALRDEQHPLLRLGEHHLVRRHAASRARGTRSRSSSMPLPARPPSRTTTT